MADVEDLLKYLHATHTGGKLPLWLGTPEQTKENLFRMGWIGGQSPFGLDEKDVESAMSLFTGLNEAGDLYKGLEGEKDATPANLSDIYETMDLRGIIGHYGGNQLARAIQALKNAGKKGGNTAEDYITKAKKEAFGEEEAGGKKGAPAGFVPEEVRELGGREGTPEYLVKPEETRFDGMSSYKTVPVETFDNLFTEYSTLAKKFQNYAIESERHIRDGKIDLAKYQTFFNTIKEKGG